MNNSTKFTFTVANDFSTESLRLSLTDLQLLKKEAVDLYHLEKKLTKDLSKLSVYKLIWKACSLIEQGKASVLVQRFLDCLARIPSQRRREIINSLHLIVSAYEINKQSNHQIVTMEKIASQCFLEIAPLDYWIN